MEIGKTLRICAVVTLILLIPLSVNFPVEAQSSSVTTTESGQFDVPEGGMLHVNLPHPNETEEIEVEVKSDHPISIYIIEEKYFSKYSIEETSFEESIYQKENITEIEEKLEYSLEGDYYLVIANHGEEITQVNYSISYSPQNGEIDNILEEFIPAFFPLCCIGSFILLGGGLLLILLVLFMKEN